MEFSIVAVVIDNLEVNQRFVSSIRQYTNGKYELIIIDNASNDRNAIDFVKKAADIYYRFDKRTDLAKAWNKGIELSKGKFVAIANNDIVVPPNWFELLKETLTKNKQAGLASPITYRLVKGYFRWGNLRNFDKTFSKPFKLVKFKDVVWGELYVFKRKVLKDVKGFCELYKVASAEDLDINFMLYKKGYDIYVDPRVFVYHQGEASQISSIIKKKKRDKIWKENFELFKSRWPKYTKGWT